MRCLCYRDEVLLPVGGVLVPTQTLFLNYGIPYGPGHTVCRDSPTTHSFREESRKSLMKNRDRIAIAAAILDVAMGGEKKSRIMYRAFLSFSQLKEYLGLLTDSGLLEYSEKEGEYRTTVKGVRFLMMYKEFEEMIYLQAAR